MNKAVIAVIVVLLVGGGIIGAVKMNKKDEPASTTMQHNEAQTTQTSDTSAGSSSVKSGKVEIHIENFAYDPATIKVKKGTKVTWTNHDSVQHTITSDTDSSGKGLDSSLLSQGQSYSFTFNEAGTYSYHCTPHPYMMASVEVVE